MLDTKNFQNLAPPVLAIVYTELSFLLRAQVFSRMIFQSRRECLNKLTFSFCPLYLFVFSRCVLWLFLLLLLTSLPPMKEIYLLLHNEENEVCGFFFKYLSCPREDNLGAIYKTNTCNWIKK